MFQLTTSCELFPPFISTGMPDYSRSPSQVNRGYENKASCKTDADHAFVKECANWKYSFADKIESSSEETDSLVKLDAFVQETIKAKIDSRSVTVHTEEFIMTKFKDQLPRISLYRYMHLWFACVSSTSFVESGNKSLEYCGFGPKPSDAIHRSADKIITHTDITHRRRQEEAQQIMNHKCPDHLQSPPNKKRQVV